MEQERLNSHVRVKFISQLCVRETVGCLKGAGSGSKLGSGGRERRPERTVPGNPTMSNLWVQVNEDEGGPVSRLRQGLSWYLCSATKRASLSLTSSPESTPVYSVGGLGTSGRTWKLSVETVCLSSLPALRCGKPMLRRARPNGMRAVLSSAQRPCAAEGLTSRAGCWEGGKSHSGLSVSPASLPHQICLATPSTLLGQN